MYHIFRQTSTRRTPSPSTRYLLAVVIAWTMALGGNARHVQAQFEERVELSREYRIKATYLYQFGRYIEWPARAFSSPKSPFVIGVMDKDPIVADLEQIARIKKIQDRPIQIRRFSSPGEVRACHILFFSASQPSKAQVKILHRVSRQGVLPVGDASEFLEWGGTIRFVVKENKVHVYIARKAAQREGLTISAKLLQVAHVVD